MASKDSQINCVFFDTVIQSENSDKARELHSKSSFGEIISNKLNFSLYEALFLLEKGKIKILNKKGGSIIAHSFEKKALKIEKTFLTKYTVYKNLRDKGYILKTGLKFGADFRAYDKSAKIGKDHSKWIIFCVTEKDLNKWQDFSAKVRVANSTKKKLLMGIVDDERDVTFYEVSWVMP